MQRAEGMGKNAAEAKYDVAFGAAQQASGDFAESGMTLGEDIVENGKAAGQRVAEEAKRGLAAAGAVVGEVGKAASVHAPEVAVGKAKAKGRGLNAAYFVLDHDAGSTMQAPR